MCKRADRISEKLVNKFLFEYLSLLFCEGYLSPMIKMMALFVLFLFCRFY